MGDDDKLRGLGKEEWFGDEEAEVFFVPGTGLSSRADRRGADRRRVHVEVRVEPGGRPGAVGDLSVGGVLVYCDVPAPPGSEVALTLLTEAGPARARGVVRWASRAGKRDALEERSGMGIQFLWVSLAMKGILDEALQAGWDLEIPGF